MLHMNVDEQKIQRARAAARQITADVQSFIDQHTTVSTERAIVRLYGVEGTGLDDIPLPNLVVQNIQDAGVLARGVAWYMANAVERLSLTPQQVAEAVGSGRLDLARLEQAEEGAVRATMHRLTLEATSRIARRRQERGEFLGRLQPIPTPWKYVIVATGNIYEDVIQARGAARQGADVIAVIRSTAQSLLDYVPEGATTEGFAGTFATQENFRIMRRALDEVSEELGRYVHLTNYASGLCMPEIAALGAMERLDMMLSDSMYGILFRDINMQRTLVDQHFARMLQAYAGIVINTGEDNYLTTDDAYEAAHTVLGSQFINEQFALRSGMTEEQLGLGHAFEMDPLQEDGLLYEMSDALLSRICFPNSPLKYMPPTRHMTGNIFMGHLMDALFNLTSVSTGQGIHLVGMLTEAIHTPFLHDRYLSLENTDYVFRYARHFSDEFQIKPGGRMEQRAATVLDQAVDLLDHIQEVGLMAAIGEGVFGRVRRTPTGGKGLDGVVVKGPGYANPFTEIMLPYLHGQMHDPAGITTGAKEA